eukprot:scaffold13343_cov78-Skeletonema_dohrnii-CCMP3373.AAC.4
MAVNSGACGRLRWLHQVTYDVFATPIPPTNASAVIKMLLNYHGHLRWRFRRPYQVPHQVTYDVAATPIRPTNA